MYIREYGKENDKTLLFFPGSCEPWQEFAYAAEALAGEYHILLVVPDGQDPEEGTDFLSVEKTADDAAAWLKAHGIKHLDALYGLSYGGGMATRFLVSQKIFVRRAIIALVRTFIWVKTANEITGSITLSSSWPLSLAKVMHMSLPMTL